MFFSIFSISLPGIHIGPAISGAYYVGGGAPDTVPPAPLVVPRQDLQKDPSIFAMLGWHVGLSEFAGRNDEIKQLQAWAESGPRVSIKFVTGDGGVGKSRLAAEFAEALQNEGWSAGFVDLRNPGGYFAHKKGTLLVVDYPEENRDGVANLLRDLANTADCTPLRALFLTRRERHEWDEVIHDSGAAGITDQEAIALAPAPSGDAYAIFQTAQAGAARARKSEPIPLTEEAFEAWLALRPEHKRPLFVVAAAVHDAIHEGPVFDYTGPEIMHNLVERELARLRRIAETLGLQRHALARLQAIAAISGGLDRADVERLADPDFRLGLPPGNQVANLVERSGVMVEDKLPAPEPDLVAACFVTDVMAERADEAPEWLWAGLEGDIADGLQRVARLAYDAEVVLGLLDHRISLWLRDMFKTQQGRCDAAIDHFYDAQLPVGLHPAAEVVWRTALELETDDANRSVLLNNLSVHLAEAGDGAGALEAIRESVDIDRRMAAANPARFEPELVSSLNNLSVRLSEAGDGARALEAIREAAEACRRLVAANPARFEPELATTLNNLSVHLGEAGDAAGALEAIREAVEIRRRLAAANPARFEPDLAQCLNNLSSDLSKAGDSAGALKAIREAVVVDRRLAAANPARFEPDLASSLNNLSNRLGDSGDGARALEAVRGAMDVYRRLAAANPARFEPDLAMSINNFSGRLSLAGDGAGALEAIGEAVDLRRRLAAANPARFEPDLAESLNNLSGDLSLAGDGAAALEAIHEAVEIYRRLVAANPARFEPDLAMSLNNLSNRLGEAGDDAGALEAIREAVELITPYAKRFPDGPHAKRLAMMEANLQSLVEGEHGG